MERWFYSGTYMPDGAPITVAAKSAVQEEEFIKKGWVPVDAVRKPATRRPVKKKRTKDK